ncbi:Stf0 family sulfotransferase [uncultured Tateyamaria sp.]|uniref:Stf0 family sulfotransferase n=1 Tax=uncultured Tateyamaria sp. TaxID=455651 RepID=UPI0026396A70|nr:Stf0 family sulfotransferase [uncultured Tateyamaria sp.]
MPGPDAYILCTTPRSGSTLLCGLLRDSGVAGNPQSYFHRPDVATWRADLDLDKNAALSDILAAAQQAGRRGTDIFGLRLQRHSADFFFSQLSQLHPGKHTDAERVTTAFGLTRYIYLTRDDKVAQAVSLVRAQQSGLWHRNADGTEHERTDPGEPLHYDADAIAAELDTLTGYDAAWRDWFVREGIEPLHLTYADLVQDPQNTLLKILHFLQIDVAALPPVALSMGKLADATSDAWIAQFNGNRGGI